MDLDIARTYASVLFDLAKERGMVDQVMDELAQFVQVLDDQPMLEKALSNPVIDRRWKVGLIRKVVAGHLSDLTARFLVCVADRGRMGLLRDMIRQYRLRLDEHMGVVEVKIDLKGEPDKAMLERLSRQVSAAIDRAIRLQVKVDPALLGGAVIHIGGLRIDNSVKGRLERAIRFLRTGTKEAYHGL